MPVQEIDRAVPTAATAGEIPQGETIGRYVVLREIGRGGMGEVYEAFDPQLERRVALKLILVGPSPDMTTGTSVDNSMAHAMLIAEAQSQAKLAHPNIVSVFDVGRSARGVFMAMELVTGGSIKQWLRERTRSWQEIVEVFLQAGDGLVAAHERGIVHRDFKPDNVLLTDDTTAKVADFGLATAKIGRRTSRNYTMSTLSSLSSMSQSSEETQAVVGTPSYMSPEQHLGEPLDARADEFSFCASLYEALYDTKPFIGKNRAELLREIEEGRLASPQSRRPVPRWLLEMIRKGLAPHPDLRYPSLKVLLSEMRDRLAFRPGRLIGVVASVVLCFAGLGITVTRADEAEQRCRVLTARAHDIWDSRARNTAELAFSDTNLSYARDVFQTVDRHLRSHLTQWTQERLDVCRHPLPDPRQQATVEECLEQKWDELSGFANLYGAPSQADVVGAAEKVAKIRSTEDCRRGVALNIDPERPTDPEKLSTYLAVTGKFESIQESSQKGKSEGALAKEAAQLIEQGAKVEAFAVVADLNDMLAVNAARHFDMVAANRFSMRSELVVDASHNDLFATRTLSNALFVAGYLLGDYTNIDEGYRHGRAHAARSPVPDLANAELCMGVVPAWATSGQNDRSIGCLRRAIATFENELGPVHPETNRAREYLAVTLGRSSRGADETLLLLQSAVVSQTAILGENHPAIAMTYYNLAGTYLGNGDRTQALDAYSHAYDILAKSDADNSLLTRITIELYELHHSQEEWQLADRYLREANELVKATDSVSLDGARALLAAIELDQEIAAGQLKEGKQSQKQTYASLAVYRPGGLFGIDMIPLMAFHLANSHLVLGEYEQLDRALAMAAEAEQQSGITFTEFNSEVLRIRGQRAVATGDDKTIEEVLQELTVLSGLDKTYPEKQIAQRLATRARAIILALSGHPSAAETLEALREPMTQSARGKHAREEYLLLLARANFPSSPQRTLEVLEELGALDGQRERLLQLVARKLGLLAHQQMGATGSTIAEAAKAYEAAKAAIDGDVAPVEAMWLGFKRAPNERKKTK